MKPFTEGFWVGTVLGVACAVLITLAVFSCVKNQSVTTLPDGRKFIQLNYQKYWVQEWVKK